MVGIIFAFDWLLPGISIVLFLALVASAVFIVLSRGKEESYTTLEDLAKGYQEMAALRAVERDEALNRLKTTKEDLETVMREYTTLGGVNIREILNFADKVKDVNWAAVTREIEKIQRLTSEDSNHD